MVCLSQLILGVIKLPIYDVLHMHCVDFVETLCSEVLVTFADHLWLLHFLTDFQWTKQTAMASFQNE